MTRRWLRLRLAGPLMSFGAVAVDHVGPTQSWPGQSMLTGLLGNALGWDWTDRAKHQALQDRLVVAATIVREGETVTDVQNAQLAKADKGWTTRGMPEKRAGASYDAPHRRRRDYLADAEIVVVLRLDPADRSPTLDDVRSALLRPARPLFLGRKPCAPARHLVEGTHDDWIKAADAHAALSSTVGRGGTRAWWPDGEGPSGDRTHDVADLRVWSSGLHGGTRRVREGRL